jgi:hypothetical protein
VRPALKVGADIGGWSNLAGGTTNESRSHASIMLAEGANATTHGAELDEYWIARDLSPIIPGTVSRLSLRTMLITVLRPVHVDMIKTLTCNLYSRNTLETVWSSIHVKWE